MKTRKKISDINYFKVLEDALSVSWQNRYLWWFGFLISLSAMGGIMQHFSNLRNNKENVWQNIQMRDFVSANLHWIIILFLFAFVVYAIFIILGLIARGALIDTLGKISKNEKSNFKIGLRNGKKYFIRIFLIGLILGLFVAASAILVVIPIIFLFIGQNYVIGILMGALAAIIFVPILILAIFLKVYGYFYAVLGDLSFWPALENGYNLFRNNMGASLVMSLLFIPLGFLLMITTAMAIIPVAVIFLMIGLILFLISGKLGIIICAVLGGIAVLISIFLVRSFWEVFSQAVWFNFFQEIAKPKIKEEIVEKEMEAEPITKPMPIANCEKLK